MTNENIHISCDKIVSYPCYYWYHSIDFRNYLHSCTFIKCWIANWTNNAWRFDEHSFSLLLFAEKSRYLTIDDEKIVLPRGANINEKTSFSRTIININEIRSIKSELHKGDGIVAKDTLFHTLTLNDGTRIKFTLYAYGKVAEDEILVTIQKLN